MKKFISYSVTIFVLLSVLNFAQIYSNLDNYEVIKYEKKQTQINLIVNNTHRLSDSLFDNIINTKKVIEIFKNAESSSVEEKVKIRKELYNLLIDNYNSFKNYGIQQLHFHLPNNDSFLRFHQISKFGDSLTDVRDSVKLVNKNKIRIVGFEEGRIFDGYRFVYPLFDENKKHIGSVELSSSLLSFKVLFEENNDTHLDYILKKDAIEKKAFNKQFNNYEQSFLENFLIQKTISKYDNNCLHKEERKIILENLSTDKKSLKKINNLEEFHKIYFHKFNFYTMGFTPLINDFNLEKVGYMIMFSKSDYFEYILNYYIASILIITLISILIAYIIHKKEKDKILIENLAMHDQLTNIYNRHYFKEKVEKELINIKKHNTELSLIMFDIDHFKVINDNCGHNIGDASLVFLTDLIKNNIRFNDVFCRWGGEEFLILTSKPLDKTILMAEYLRNLIDEETKKSKSIPYFTCSFGVVALNRNTSIKELIQKVDKLLYKSKEEGRNKVSF